MTFSTIYMKFMTHKFIKPLQRFLSFTFSKTAAATAERKDEEKQAGRQAGREDNLAKSQNECGCWFVKISCETQLLKGLSCRRRRWFFSVVVFIKFWNMVFHHFLTEQIHITTHSLPFITMILHDNCTISTFIFSGQKVFFWFIFFYCIFFYFDVDFFVWLSV